MMREKMVEAGLWPADDPRDPSEEIGSAWQVVEKLLGEGQLHNCRVYGWQEEWSVVLNARNGGSGTAATLPLAICLAALKACGVEYNEKESA